MRSRRQLAARPQGRGIALEHDQTWISAAKLDGVGLQSVDHTKAFQPFLAKSHMVTRAEFKSSNSIHVSLDKGRVGGCKWTLAVAQICRADRSIVAAVLPPQVPWWKMRYGNLSPGRTEISSWGVRKTPRNFSGSFRFVSKLSYSQLWKGFRNCFFWPFMVAERLRVVVSTRGVRPLSFGAPWGGTQVPGR